jgi:pyridoxal phosphate enzyme (YggS family)
MLTAPQFSPGRLAEFRERMATAARAAGRAPESVTLVGVGKTQPPAVLAAARAAGLTDLAENYLQEALPKIAQLPRAGTTWHFIGALQANKTRAVAEHFDWVHTVDRLKLAERLSAQRPFHGQPLQLLIQVNIGGEASKGGVEPAALPALARAITALPRIALRGLMCVPPPSDAPLEQRGFFAQLRRLRDDLAGDGLALDVLSMGMSTDFEAAIHEGATHIRIGTALFGPRDRAA